MNTPLDHSLLEAALEGLTLKHERVIAQIAEIRRRLGSSLPARMPSSAAEPHPEPNSKRTMSAAGRRAIAEAQRKRWAAKKEKEAEVEPKPQPKRKLSAAGRRAIVEATRKRWAAVREAKAKAERAAKTATKKPATKAAKKVVGKRIVKKAAAKKSGTMTAKPRPKESVPVQPETAAPVQADVVETAPEQS